MDKDIKLYYTEKGSGEPLILLHGNGESGEYFRAQIEYFSKFYRVIAPDTRGHGKSPRGSAPFTIEQFAEDIFAFMTELNIESAYFLGFSDGGNIALTLALAHPEKVKKLILNGANLFPAGLVTSLRIINRAALFLCSPFARRKAELLRLMTDQPDIKPEQLADVSVPTLVIAGSRDLIKRSHTELIANSIPDSELCILRGTHSVAADSPEEFNKAVHGFLKA